MGRQCHHEHEQEPEPEHHVANPEPEHMTNLWKLPEKCISRILSFSTPRDVCRLAAVSRRFRSAANSDTTWDKFLPRHCDQILSKAVFRPIVFSSKKELYFRLCDSILIDGRKKRFWLERSTAKIAYMLSATELFIAWGNDQRYWRWVYREDSRFGELAELQSVWWLEVWGGMDRRLLSENTDYRVLFVLKLTDDSVGWNRATVKFSVTTPAEKSDNSEGSDTSPVTIPEEEVIESEHSSEKSDNSEVSDTSPVTIPEEEVIEYEQYSEKSDNSEGSDGVSKDGWMEVVAGEFRVGATENVDDDSSHIEFRMKDTSNHTTGLLIDGVKIEPC